MIVAILLALLPVAFVIAMATGRDRLRRVALQHERCDLPARAR
jgi:hypothetical protein